MARHEDADAEAILDHDRQYGHGPLSEAELDAKYPGRPRNIHKTLPFHDLFETLFDPLLENAKGKRTNPPVARRKQGPHGPAKLSPSEVRSKIIHRFISRWRSEVGDDFYPAFRLIVPDKDRDRPMYGLKERAIARLLIKLLKIGSNTEDASNLLNWKLPSHSAVSGVDGDFPSKCHAVLKKRPMRTEVGDMRIAEVNELLDRLAAAQKEDSQLSIFTGFYNRMNPDEMHWLIRIILRRLNMGATERTFFNVRVNTHKYILKLMKTIALASGCRRAFQCFIESSSGMLGIVRPCNEIGRRHRGVGTCPHVVFPASACTIPVQFLPDSGCKVRS